MLETVEEGGCVYGDTAVHDALAVATAYRNFDARAIERILARAHPTVVPEPIVAPAARRPEALRSTLLLLMAAISALTALFVAFLPGRMVASAPVPAPLPEPAQSR